VSGLLGNEVHGLAPGVARLLSSDVDGVGAGTGGTGFAVAALGAGGVSVSGPLVPQPARTKASGKSSRAEDNCMAGTDR
jgi:hypothetical protein